MEILEKIFGSANKVKIMRLFLFNPNTAFDAEEIIKRTKVPKTKARRELSDLDKINLIKKRVFTKEIKTKSKTKKKKLQGWVLNKDFPYLLPLQNFLVHISSSQQKGIVDKIKKLGSVKLLVLSGVFIQEWESRIDILVVGDKIKPANVDSVISNIESEVGKEINYCFFDTSDFLYRLGVCDKLIRDILDYPHKKAINKLDLY